MGDGLYHRGKPFEKRLILVVKRVPKLYMFPEIQERNNCTELNKAWDEVSRISGAPAYRCRSRWQQLFKTFLKQRAKRESKHGHASKRKRHKNWPYYERMSFLLQHKDLSSSPNAAHTLFVSNEECLSEKDIELVEPPKVPNFIGRLARPQMVEELVTCQEGVEQQLSACNHAISLDSTTENEQPLLRIEKVYSMQGDTVTSEPFTITNNHPPAALFALSSTANERCTQNAYDDTHLSCRSIDSDEQFLMSCYTTMKHLSRKRNALVRLQIQQLMYEAEFADEEDGRNVSNNR